MQRDLKNRVDDACTVLLTWISLTLPLTTPEFLSNLMISFSVRSPSPSTLPGLNSTSSINSARITPLELEFSFHFFVSGN